jgi:hypothetical protein
LAKFAELTGYKNTIIERILESQDICKAIYYNELNFLEQVDIQDVSSLVHTKIMPQSFVPDISEGMSTFVSIHFKRFRTINSSFKNGFIYISIFSHKDLFKTSYGTTRVDYLLNKLDEKFNRKRGIGMGELELYEMDEFTVNPNYSGAYLCYKPVDFN